MQHHKGRQRGFSTTLAAVIALVLAAGSTTALYMTSFVQQSGPDGQPGDSTPLSRKAERLLTAVGLTADELTAAGVSPELASTIGARARSEASNSWDTITAQRAAVGTHRQEAAARTRKIQTGHAGEGDVAACSQANEDAATADALLQTSLTNARNNILGGVDSKIVAKLDHLRAGRSWNLPLQYRVVSRTEAQWIELRDAYLEVRSAEHAANNPEATPREADAAAAAAMETANGDLDVIASKTALDNNLVNVRAALASALNGE